MSDIKDFYNCDDIWYDLCFNLTIIEPNKVNFTNKTNIRSKILDKELVTGNSTIIINIDKKDHYFEAVKDFTFIVNVKKR